MGSQSPTQRALAYCKKQGWEAAIVERWNPYARIRQDLFGFADLVVLRPSEGVYAVQVTSTGVAERIAKIKAEPRALAWLRAGGKIEVWGWRKLKVKRGGKAVRWTMRVEAVTEEDFA